MCARMEDSHPPRLFPSLGCSRGTATAAGAGRNCMFSRGSMRPSVPSVPCRWESEQLCGHSRDKCCSARTAVGVVGAGKRQLSLEGSDWLFLDG